MLHERHKNLTQADMQELVTYQPPTGKAFWNYRDVKWFNGNKRICNSWNAQFAGREITSIGSHGYLYPSLFGKPILLHRLVWFRETGEWPEGEIDHINGNRIDNRWINLREVTSAENRRNQKLPCDNISGVLGVSFDFKSSKWRARIGVKGKDIFLGYFSSFEEAVVARKAAEIKYGFHENHGRE